MQLRSKITVARNSRIHHDSLLNVRKAQNAVVLGLEVTDGMVSLKTTLKQQKRFNSAYNPNIFTCQNTELQRVQVNQGQFQFACYSRKQFRPSFLLGSLFSKLTSLDCLMIFTSTRHECVIVFIKCFCSISLYFILCLVLIF